MATNLNEDEIRAKAYELWEKAGCPEGRAEDYWAQAQMILSGGAASDASEFEPSGVAPDGVFDEDAPVKS
ncbi:DUF2934 domain-containing protein [Caballeronia sp.]|uniref:DUF2934 domain-containing protein n=1 Tax=Caballeronia sp. TaxID=1931223 RepID=UPI003C5C8DB2